MSRIGKRPIALVKGVDIKVDANNHVTVKGPKGTLTRQLDPELGINIEPTQITVTRPSESIRHRQVHGLTRSLLDNMVIGVSTGYRRELGINGVGYRALKDGEMLVMLLGYSHSIRIEPPAGIKFVVEGTTKVFVEGIDKELVGEQAAKIRSLRPPEPYKGKGVKYVEEVIRRKQGKTGGKGKK